MSSFSLPITTFVSARMSMVIPFGFFCRVYSTSCFRLFISALRLLFSVVSAVILEFYVFLIFFSIWANKFASGTSSQCHGAGSCVTAVAIRTGSYGGVSTWKGGPKISSSGGTISCGAVGSCVTTISIRTGSCGSVLTWIVDSYGTVHASTIGDRGRRIETACFISCLPIASLIDLVDLVFLLSRVETKVVDFFFVVGGGIGCSSSITQGGGTWCSSSTTQGGYYGILGSTMI
jgi:hypothetical protein